MSSRRPSERLAGTRRSLTLLREDLALTYAMSEAANESGNLEDVVAEALEMICEHMGWAVGHALAVDREDARARGTQLWHFAGGPELERLRTDSGELERFSLADRAIHDQTPLVLHHLEAEHGSERAELAATLGLHHYFVLPIISGSVVVAALEFFATKPDARGDLALVQLLANLGMLLGRVAEREARAEQRAALRHSARARTEAEARARELLRVSTELRQAVAARDGVLAVVSHDLRGPLNNIQLSLALLENEDPGTRRMAIDSIRRAVTRSNRLITDLLDVSQFESGKIELELRALDPGALARAALAEVAALAQRHGNELVLEVDDGLGEIQADRERLIQVMDNLLRNAIKYGPSASQIEVRVRASPASTDCVEISISDRGPGIDERDRGQVFERFWQAEDRAKSSGSGLGLAIAKSLVEAHHGQIAVDQAAEGGARFYFTVPFVDPR
ncbi:Sensory box histidine kinase [Enhygromyxa salina]|uniref:histidine kinase n=1 Tax=Enhygromyxa salina TaxID=215803 RepID=A0A0C1ZLD4_9BACT|nr:GAF domain-containing sensor histidine kinase [Enhygromyxa salina]KIG18349.1 Sensory box histidine kinase [Enhygromyxa salina]